MNLEDQLCSLELSKELLTCGLKQNSLFYWYYAKYDGVNTEWKPIYGPSGLMPDRYSAFTASELLDLLPNRITLDDRETFNSFTLYIKKSFILLGDFQPVAKGAWGKVKFIYIINYECDSTSCEGEDAGLRRYLFEHNISDKNFCNALAKILIQLDVLQLLTLRNR